MINKIYLRWESFGDPSCNNAQRRASKSISNLRWEVSRSITHRTRAYQIQPCKMSQNVYPACGRFFPNFNQHESRHHLKQDVDFEFRPNSSGWRLFFASRFLTRLALDNAMASKRLGSAGSFFVGWVQLCIFTSTPFNPLHIVRKTQVYRFAARSRPFFQDLRDHRCRCQALSLLQLLPQEGLTDHMKLPNAHHGQRAHTPTNHQYYKFNNYNLLFSKDDLRLGKWPCS